MPGYQVRVQRIAIAGGDDLLIRSLLNRQQFSDPHGEAAALGISTASWPLFGQLWPSARVLADALQSFPLTGMRILEIGCGLGLASLVAHRRRADVTASDHHPLVQPFLTENLRINALPPLAYQVGNWDGTNPQLGKFDLIIGSDLLYERDQPGVLSSFIDRHAHDAARVLLVDPNRGYRNAFSRCMSNVGYSVSTEQVDQTLADGDQFRGRMLTYQRS